MEETSLYRNKRKTIFKSIDRTAFYSIQPETDVETSSYGEKPVFRGAHTAKEMAKIVGKYVPVVVDDIHDLLNDVLSDELHYYLCSKLDVSSVNMDNVVYLNEYKSLVEDLCFYLNIEG
jgi:hypothetical protein